MAKEEGGASSFTSSGFVWAAMLAAGVFVGHVAPWQGSRPAATDPKPYAYLAAQDVDARLWQDPLSAVARAREGTRKQAGTEASKAKVAAESCTSSELHDPCRLRQAIEERETETGQKVELVGVMVQGGTYAESVEARRRARYAVIAALSQHGYRPEDSAHIGYVVPASAAAARLPEFIGYEWYRPDDAAGRSILVVWLDEYVFGDRTRSRLDALTQLLVAPRSGDRPVGPRARWSIVGPTYGSTLEAMVKAPLTEDPCRALPKGTTCDATFYAFGPTADAAHLLHASTAESADALLRTRLEERHLDVLRTVLDDSALAGRLQDELGRRDVEPSTVCAHAPMKAAQHVVLVSELDTFYGRTVPRIVGERLFEGCSEEQRAARIHRYSYLRGLDGQLPAAQRADASERAETSVATDAKGGDRQSSANQIERPEGQGQLDYLRRMALTLAELETDLRKNGNGTIKAIGVLGSDVFDKLQVLQALRPLFPGVSFFTTDLDARLLHPREQDWARNLIVASSFGLTLRPELQNDIPPFRDTYQTGIYLSTLIALNNVVRDCARTDTPGCVGESRIRQWFAGDSAGNNARLFEIGRTRAFDFAPPVMAGSERCSVRSLAQCGSVHPVGDLLLPSGQASSLQPFVFAAIVASLLLWGAMRVGRRLRDRPAPDAPADAQATMHRHFAVLVAWWGATVVVITIVFLSAQPAWTDWFVPLVTEGGHGEPMSFSEGVSIWPSEFLRAAALILALVFIFISWRGLNRNLADISERLHFEPDLQEMRRLAYADYERWPAWTRFVRMFSFKLDHRDHEARSDVSGFSWDAQRFWKKYIYQGRVIARAVRVLVFSMLFAVGAWLLIEHFGMPGTPYRGAFAKQVDAWTIGLTSAAMLASIFFVVDATVFCSQLVDGMTRAIAGNTGDQWRSTKRLWSQSTIDYYRRRYGIRGKYVDAKILIDFVSLRTRVVANLVYFPFIIVSLLAFARSRYFDNWTMPVGLVIVLSVAVAIVIICAVLLRETAERARALVLGILDDERLRLKRRAGTSVGQVEALIERIRTTRIGAFAPYSQQPVLKAVLLTVGTFGGPALLDQLTLWNL